MNRSKIGRTVLLALSLITVSQLGRTPYALATEADVAAAEKVYEQVLEKINADYEVKVKAAEAEAAAKRKAAAAPLLAKLNAEVTAATKKGDLDAAIKWREQIKALQDGEKIQPLVGKQKLSGVLLASAEGSYVIYVNGVRFSEGGGQVIPVPIKLKVGDIITVRTTRGEYGWAFECLILFQNAKLQITTNTTTWKSYTPKNALKWFDSDGIAELEDAKLGSRDGSVRPEMEKFVLGDQQAIWGPDKVSYLTLTLTDDTLQELTATPVKKKQS